MLYFVANLPEDQKTLNTAKAILRKSVKGYNKTDYSTSWLRTKGSKITKAVRPEQKRVIIWALLATLAWLQSQ